MLILHQCLLRKDCSSIDVINRCTALEIELNEIKSLLENIDPNKAVGPDGVYGKILKEGRSSIAKTLYWFLNNEDWKMAYVMPNYKKGSKEDLGNFRPVNLTSLVVKVLEKLLKSHLDGNKILHNFQHGFRKDR